MNERSEYGKQVAATILQQIKASDFWALGAWGAHGYVCSSKPRELVDEHGKPVSKLNGPALQFDVKGAKFRGRIYISLEPSDTYKIVAIKIGRAPNYTVKLIAKHEDVYCQDLVRVLDSIIEK